MFLISGVKTNGHERRAAQHGTHADAGRRLNAQDVKVFRERQARWSFGGQDHDADRGHRGSHQRVDRVLKTFPNQHLDNRPYRISFASGDFTCSMRCVSAGAMSAQ